MSGINAALVDMCTKFLKGFKKGKKYTYFDSVLGRTGTEPLLIDFIDLESLYTNPVIGKDTEELVTIVLDRPAEAMSAFEEAAKQLALSIDPDADVSNLRVRFKNIPTEIEIPDIRMEHVGKLVSVTAV